MTPPPTPSAVTSAPTEPTPPPSSPQHPQQPSSKKDQDDGKRKNSQNEKKTASVSETGRNGKRHCTRSATSTTTVSVKQEPDEETKKEHENTKNDDDEEDVTTVPVKQELNEEERKEHRHKKSNDEEEDDDDELPTTMELSKVLCRIVDTSMDKYSREDGAATLRKIEKWLRTGDMAFLKSFLVLGAGVIVLNFLTATMNDVNCTGNNRLECIEGAALVIADAARGGRKDGPQGTNRGVAMKIVTSIVEYNGVSILINASKEYIGGDNESQLAALDSVWTALWNIVTVQELEIQEDQAIAVLATGIAVISLLESLDTTLSNGVLETISATLDGLVEQSYLTTEFCIHFKSRYQFWTQATTGSSHHIGAKNGNIL